MKITSPFATLAILGAAAFPLSGCTVTTGDVVGIDGAAPEAASDDVQGSPPDGMSEAAADTADAQAASPNCGATSYASVDGGPSCDECVVAHCCAAAFACDAIDGGADADPPCVQNITCIDDCVHGSADAGVAPNTFADCRDNICSSAPNAVSMAAGDLYTCLKGACPGVCFAGQ